MSWNWSWEEPNKQFGVNIERLDAEVLWMAGFLSSYCRFYGLPIKLTSAWRSWDKQMALYLASATGLAPLAAHPDYSWHVKGRAFDISSDCHKGLDPGTQVRCEKIAGYITIVRFYPGFFADVAIVWKWLTEGRGRWGGDFTISDPIHFDLPLKTGEH